MKFQRIPVLPVGCAVVLGFLSAAAGQGPTPGTAKVIRLNGSARYTTGQYIWHPIKVGQVLQPGTLIQTSNDSESSLDLVLGHSQAALEQPPLYRPGIASSMASSTMSFRPTSEQNVVRIWPDTALSLERLMSFETGSDVVTETVLDLKRGRLTAHVKKLPAAAKYEVRFPNGVASVRGTVFDLRASGLVEVYLGSVVVAWVDPKSQKVTTQTVSGGQSYHVADNQVVPLSTESTLALEALSTQLLVTEIAPNVVTIAPDRTVVGMSPVGAAPGSVQPGNSAPNETDGSGFTAHPPVSLGQH